MSSFRKGKSKPLYILGGEGNKTWIKIQDKKNYYKNLSIQEIRGLIISQQMMLNIEAKDERSKRRLKSTISKLIKVLADRTGESRKKKDLQRKHVLK